MIQLYTKRCGSITIIDNNMNIQKNEWLIDVIHTIPWKGNKVTMDFNNTCKTIFLWAGIKTYYSNLKWFLTRIWLVSFDSLVGIIPHNSYCHRKFMIIPNDWDSGTQYEPIEMRVYRNISYTKSKTYIIQTLD